MLAEIRVKKLYLIIFLYMSMNTVVTDCEKYDEHEMFVLLPGRENQ